MVVNLALAVIYFVLYSFFGWVHELIFSAVVHHKLHLQGFLTLPLLPIYGFGALGILAATYPYADNPLMVFISAVIVATLLELITSTFLLKAFNLRLWDYTKWPANYKGKVSLLSSLGFGLLGLLLLYVIQPFMQRAVDLVPAVYLDTVATFLFVIIVSDFIFSTRALARTKKYHFSLPHTPVSLSVSLSNPISVHDIHKQNIERVQKIFRRLTEYFPIFK